jgi:hypothetical protein
MIAMSAVKPMRLSFKNILDPNSEGPTTAGSSPFKRRLNEMFSAGGYGVGRFDDLLMTTSSPSKMEG